MMDDVKDGRPRRAYQSPVRDESARRTRQAIVAAATELFGTRGYLSVSMTEIGAAAGIARPTVFAAFGSKPLLLREVVDQALAGDDAPVPVAERPWFAPVWTATTPPDALDGYAGVCVLIAQRAARLFETVRRAADDAPEVAALWDTLTANRRAGAAMVVEHVRTLGELAPGLEPESATDILWILNDPAHYAALVLGRGWTEQAYRRWLAGSMHAAILPH